MVDHATAKYLSDNVGDVLSKALADMSVTQPADGVDFLAHWLRTYAEQQEAKEWREREDALFEDERVKMKQKLDEKESTKQEAVAEKATKDDAYVKLLGKLNDTETAFQDALWTEVVDMAKSVTGATSVYLGLQDDEGIEGSEGVGCIRYEYVSSGSEFMLEKTLPKEKGVTWAALTENPTTEIIEQSNLWTPPPDPNAPPPPAEGEEPPEGTKPAWPYLPVSITSCVDVEQVHYFEMTRLGAYLAVPLVYPSYYTSDGLTDAKAFLEAERAEEKARLEAEEAARLAAEAAAEAGEAADPAPVVEIPKAEEKVMVLRGTDVKMVLCMDTLPFNIKIEESKFLEIMELCKAAGQSKSRTETKQVRDQAAGMIDEELRTKLEEEIEKARADAQAAVQETCDQEDAAAEDDGKDLIKKKFAFLQAQKVVAVMKDAILQMKEFVVVSAPVVDIIAATAFMFGYSKADVYPRRKTTLQWEKLKTVLDDVLFSTFQKTDVAGIRKNLIPEHKLSFIQSKIPADFDEAKAKDVSPAFEVLFVLVKTACEYRRAELDYRKVTYDKKKALAESGEEGVEPFTDPPLAELDDDFVE